MSPTVEDRALGALYGLAMGDALGMPTQMLSRKTIAARIGAVDGFLDGQAMNPISAGMPAGHVTDDTDQALILAHTLIDGNGRVDPLVFADRLLAWEQRMRDVGSHDLLGPSTRRALAALAEGADPSETGRRGDTNGAAMRIAPIGIATPARPLDALLEAVESSSSLTHATSVALAGAAAIAAGISAAMDGADAHDAFDYAIVAASAAQTRGTFVAGADVGRRIRWAIDLVSGRSEEDALDLVDTLIGTGVATQEAVPAAFAIASMAPADPWHAATMAASLGGDADTVAAMTGAVVGALCGVATIPAAARAQLDQVNDLGLAAIADSLLDLRRHAATRSRAAGPQGTGSPLDAQSSPSLERRPSRLVLVGSVLIDLVLNVSELPGRGGDVLATEAVTAVGGGFNVLCAAARLGMPAAYAGLVGDGPFGARCASALLGEGITKLFPAHAGSDTGYCVVLVEPDGERTFATAPGAEAALDRSVLATYAPRADDVIHLSGYALGYPHGRQIGAWLCELPGGTTVVFDPGPLAAGIDEDLLTAVLGRVDWLSLSRRELELLAPGASRPDAVRRLRSSMSGSAGVIVRDGAHGCRLFDVDHDDFHVPALPVVPVDTTGAGDVHVGAFIATLAGGACVETAAQVANVAAAISTTRRGPATAPDSEAIRDSWPGDAWLECPTKKSPTRKRP